MDSDALFVDNIANILNYIDIENGKLTRLDIDSMSPWTELIKYNPCTVLEFFFYCFFFTFQSCNFYSKVKAEKWTNMLHILQS